MTQIIYRVDKDDKITFVNSGWVKFANSNGLPAPASKNIIGTRLWKHVSDMTVRHFYKVLMGKARKTGETISVPFRCDSATTLRFMEMKITTLENGELEFRSVLLREENREGTGTNATARSALPASLIMCLWCDRVQATEWLEPERAAHELKIFEHTVLPLISHAICPQCAAQGRSTVLE